jgi:hypothetical protein
MILNKRLKILWVVITLLSVAALYFLDYKLKILAAFTITSIFIFGFDLWKNYTEIYSKSEKYKSLHAWNLMSNLGQIFFWSYLLMFIFIINEITWLYWFIFIDLFVVSTYLNYKFKNKMLNYKE